MSRLLHPNAAHVADTLISRGHHGVVVNSPQGTHTAADAAAALGVEVGAIVKSMVFLLDDEPVLLLVSGAHNVHLEHTGERLGGRLARADLDTAKHATGQPIGGIAPVGHPTNLDTFVDQDLAGCAEVWAAAGHVDTIFRSTFAELVRITAGLAIDVT